MSLFKRTITLVCLLSTSSLIGKDWVGGTPGSEEVWNEATNWDPVGVPQTGDGLDFRNSNFRNITIDSSLAASYQFTNGLAIYPSTGSYTFTPTGSGSFSWNGDTAGTTDFSVEEGGNNSFAVPLAITNNGTLNIVPYPGTSINFSASIADDLGFTGNVQISPIDTGATVIFSGTNTYTGTTTVVGGTLKGGSSGAFPTMTSFILNDGEGTLDLNGYSYSFKSIVGGETDTITNSSTTTAILTTSGDLNFPFFGAQIIDGSPSQKVGLTVSGVNPLYLTGLNKYSGPTHIEIGGTLEAHPDLDTNHGLSPNSDYIVDGTLLLSQGNHPTLNNVTLVNSLAGTSTDALIYADNDTTLTIAAGGNKTFAGKLGELNSAGNLGFTLSSGTLTLAGESIFEAPTTISAGATLKAGSQTAFSPVSPHTVDGTLDLNGNSNSVGMLSNSAGVTTGRVETTAGAATLIITGQTPDGDEGNFLGQITGNISLTLGDVNLGGFPQQTLSGINNNYLGTTTLLIGELIAGSNTAFSPNSDMIIGSEDGNGPELILGSYAVTVKSLSGFDDTAISGISGSAVLTVVDGAGKTFPGVIRNGGTGTVGLTLSSGILTLTGPNTYTGGTTINGGTLALANNGTIAATGPLTVNGIFDISQFSGGSLTVGNLSGSSSVGSIHLGDKSFTTTGSINTTYSGSIEGTGVTFRKAGSGILTLAGNNTYTGTTAIDAGTLALSSTGTIVATNNLSVAGIFDITQTSEPFAAGNLSGPSTGIIHLGNKQFTTTGSGNTTYSGIIDGSGATFTLAGSGILTLTGNNTYTGATTINVGRTLAFSGTGKIAATSDLAVGGTLDISQISASTFTAGNLSVASTGIINLGNKQFIAGGSTNTTYSGTINGAGGSFTKTGSGILTLEGTSTYTGATTISVGILKAGSITAFSTTSPILLAGTVTLDTGGFNNTILSLAGTSSTSVVQSSTGASTLILSYAIPGDTIYAGTIINGTGSLGITKNGNSKLTLSGANTYSGTTTISAGTIAAGSATGLSSSSPFTLSGTGTLDMGGFSNTILSLTGASGTTVTNTGAASTLTVTGSGSTLFLGKIINSVGLTLGTSGTLQLANTNNTYSGATTINGTAKLQATAANVFSPNSVVILGAAGILDFNGQGNTIANLSGSGHITLSSNTATGILTVGSDNQASTFSGIIQDGGTFAGALTKEGTGKLSLTGDSTYTGPTLITGGELAVLGALDTSLITVQAGATVSGTGPVSGNVTIQEAGMFSPGASPGPPFVLAGNYTQEAGSTLHVDIDPTTSDQVFAGGIVHIDPTNTTFNMIPLTGDYTIPFQYTVITGASVTGSFANFTSLPLVSGYLTYTPTSVILNLGTLNPITNFISTGNGGAVAFTIDTVFDSGSTALDGIVGTLVSLATVAEIDQAMYAMQPALYKGATLAQQNNSVLVRSALTERLQTILDTQHCSAAKSSEKQKTICQKDERKLHIWINGVGDYQHQGGLTFFSSPQIGYKNDTSGLVSGVDYNFCKNFYAGALGAYTYSDVRWEQDQGNADIDSGYAGLYLSAIGKMFYGNLSVVGAWSHFNEERNIIYTNVFKTTNNSHHGQQLISHFDTGLNLQFNRFAGVTIRPFDSFDWIVQKEDAFTEHGAGQWDLSVTKSHANMLRNELGFNLAACHCTKDAKWTLDTKLSWVREMRVSGKSYDAEFAAVDTVPFTVIGYFPSRSLISTGASLSAVAFKDRLTCTVYYNGAFGKSYSENTIGGQLNCGF